MKLVYLWIYKYKGEYLDKIGFHFSNELAVTVRYKGVKREKSSTIYGEIEVDKVFVDLKIKKSKEKAVPKSLYGDHILGMTAVVGKNGAGKTALLHAVMQSDNMQPDITGKEPLFWLFIMMKKRKNFK